MGAEAPFAMLAPDESSLGCSLTKHLKPDS